MKSYTKVYWLYALSPLHVGVGQGLGFIDLPIVREKATNWPLIPGSAIKGVWRDQFTSKNISDVNVIFGQDGDTESTAGSIVISDAKIAFLPVRSLFGTFAYVTSPLALKRMLRDLSLTINNSFVAPNTDKNKALIVKDSILRYETSNTVYLEDLDLVSEESQELTILVNYLAESIFAQDKDWQNIFKERVLVVSDNVFDYLTVHATQVVARTKIDSSTNTVAPGALWYEESLPAETILMGLLWCDRVLKADKTPKSLLDLYFNAPFMCQIGGNETTGSGRVKCVFTGGKEV